MAHQPPHHPSRISRLRRCARSPICLAALAFLGSGSPHAEEATLPEVKVSARPAAPTASVAGFGAVDAWRTPLQSRVWDSADLERAGVKRLADLTSLNASVSDSYNAPGYWDTLSVRGFTLDNRSNYRRDGLPISTETSLPLDNKSAVEVLAGTSGMQAGVSSPGGLANYVVKRPVAKLRSVLIQASENGSLLGAVDVSDRFGDAGQWGLRINAANENLRPLVHDERGNRNLLAIAADWRVSADTLLEAEVEHSHRAQPSVPGFSLLGDRLPPARDINPRINLNNQPWSLPVVFDATTASVRITQQIDEDWRVLAHGLTQRLRTDDRLAYPFGCSAEGKYDRYCSNGDFDVYAFRSDGEHRRSDALDLALKGRLRASGLTHEIESGVLVSRATLRTQAQTDSVNTVVGTGNISAGAIIDSTAVDRLDQIPNNNRSEHNREIYLRDAVELAPEWRGWLGLRHTRLSRGSVLTDGSEPINYTQSFTTPWLALSHEWDGQRSVYLSWGEGVESKVAPNRPSYLNAGQPLPALKSRQFEFGIKGRSAASTSAGTSAGTSASSARQPQHEWSLNAFSIHRPYDADDCDSGGICTKRQDGRQVHNGLEARHTLHSDGWTIDGSALLMQARLRGQTAPSLANGGTLSGKAPTNTPQRALTASATYDLASVPGLSARGGLVYESRRAALPDNSVFIPGWTRVDAGAEYHQRAGATAYTWSLGVTNLLDRRAWRESPFQFGHAYLYPLAPRTWTIALHAQI